jgi:hypothetical protein
MRECKFMKNCSKYPIYRSRFFGDSYSLDSAHLIQSNMNASIKTALDEHGRDARIFLVLGIANWFIFVDHIPNNAVNLLTLRNFGFSGAADLFIFTAGYAAAILYGKMALERGLIVAMTRILKRVWQLYAAYVVMFVLYVDVIGSVAVQYAAPDIIDEYNVIGIVGDPTRTLLHGLLLQATPLNLDSLQLLITLMAVFPLALASMLRWPKLTLIGSITLYLAARQFDLYVAAFPEGRWHFNPFCWQLLFVLGAWFALQGTRQVHAWQQLPILRQLALAYLLFALVITVAGKVPQLGSMIPDALLGHFTPADRENLAPHRLLNTLALAFLFTYLVPHDWKGLHAKPLQAIMKCGEEWLPCFCAGVFLSFAGHLVLITGPNSLTMQVLVSAAGIAMMAAVAYYVSWSRLQDHRPALKAKA